jgi:hypothetical protein
MEMNRGEKISFLKDWIAERGATENLERLLCGLERENVLRVDLVPKEIFHILFGSNVSAISKDELPRLQEICPDYGWPSLRERGMNVCICGDPDWKEVTH